MKKILTLVTGIILLTGSLVNAQSSNVVDGQTSVLLDTDLLSMAAGLDLSSVSSDVGMGSLGDASVAFDINPRDAMSQPTTFSYTPGTLAPFSGSIEHAGSVFFNNDTVEVGNFSIGFDMDRVIGDNSGFFVESTTGVAAILFDIGNVTELTPNPLDLTIEASLLVSPEFATFLGDAGLVGADVGDARVEASAVPEPNVAIGICLLGLAMIKRRSRS